METTAELTKTVERMSESFAQPDMQERSRDWFERSAKESRQEEKEKHSGPREIDLKGAEPEWREWVESVGEKDESAKEPPRRNEQRADGEKSAAESTNSPVAPKPQGKLTQAEAETHWRQISAGTNQTWQKAVAPELARALGKIENAKEVMQHFAAQPEILRSVQNVDQLRATVHTMSEIKQAVAKHPDAEAKIKSATNDIVAKAPPYLQHMINDSEVLGELLYTLADPTMINKLLETAKTNPGKAVRVLHDMEIDIKRALSNEKAPESRRPRAPRPPTELPARSGAGDDGTRGEMNFRDFSRKMEQRYAHAR